VEQFLAALGSKTPSPGGGAVSALSGALGSAQLLMVAEYSKWEDGAPDPKGRLRELGATLLALATEDAEAYSEYSIARGKRKEEPEAYARAQERIADVPLRILEACVEACEKVSETLKRAPAWFACDTAIAAGCLTTGAEGARALCGANLGYLPAPSAEALAAKLAALERRLESCRREMDPLMLTRLPGK
jgi:formiminotetrahydrofolate cyclodeaminase